MEVVALNGSSSNAPPFRREVHEWQHVDTKTGALLSGRAEANRYVNGNLNTYGKVSQKIASLALICALWRKKLIKETTMMMMMMIIEKGISFIQRLIKSPHLQSN